LYDALKEKYGYRYFWDNNICLDLLLEQNQDNPHILELIDLFFNHNWNYLFLTAQYLDTLCLSPHSVKEIGISNKITHIEWAIL